MVRFFALLAIAATVAATANTTAQNICGELLSQIDAYGDEIVTNSKNINDSHDCCNQCDKQPECVVFVQGGTNEQHICRLLRKVYTLEKIQTYLVFKGYVYNTIFMKGREAPDWGKCGDARGDFQGCTSGFYCQPWEPNYYQCVAKPAQCSIETNVDYYGGDLKKVSGLNPGACCDECVNTSGCSGYTFVNDTPDGPQCYLKSKNTASDRQTKVGAISGFVTKA